MGIKGLSKVLLPIAKHKNIQSITKKYKSEMSETPIIAIDAYNQLYAAALAAQSVTTLTDSQGEPTLHIQTILSQIMNFHKNNFDQLWVFDYQHQDGENFHNPAKAAEVEKRSKKKSQAKEQLVGKPSDDLEDDQLSSSQNQPTSSQPPSSPPQPQPLTEEKRNMLEKQAFGISEDIIADVKFILNCLKIKYIDSPKGFEAEHIASYLSATDQIFAVWSGDLDAIPFGAKRIFRKNLRDKLIYEYDQSHLLEQIQSYITDGDTPTVDHLRKISVVLGCDFAPKTPKIAEKTVLRKFLTVELTEQQEAAMRIFQSIPDDDIATYNLNKTPMGTVDDRKKLINWLVEKKNFNRERVEKMLLSEK